VLVRLGSGRILVVSGVVLSTLGGLVFSGGLKMQENQTNSVAILAQLGGPVLSLTFFVRRPECQKTENLCFFPFY
jgi:hypothetical protein